MMIQLTRNEIIGRYTAAEAVAEQRLAEIDVKLPALGRNACANKSQRKIAICVSETCFRHDRQESERCGR
jgi:hypothetical protein